MPRIRSLKPEFFQNEELANCCSNARLLFAGLWCWADRAGRLEDRPSRLRIWIFPYEESVNVDMLLVELEHHKFIARYEVNEVNYIQVLTFEKHQKPHPKEAESVIPAPGYESREKVLPSREKIVTSRVVNGSGNGSNYGSGNGQPLPRPPGSADYLNDRSHLYAIEELESSILLNAIVGDLIRESCPHVDWEKHYRDWWLSRVKKGGIGRRKGDKATLQQYAADIEGYFRSWEFRLTEQPSKPGNGNRYESASERNVKNIRRGLGLPADSDPGDYQDAALLLSPGAEQRPENERTGLGSVRVD